VATTPEGAASTAAQAALGGGYSRGKFGSHWTPRWREMDSNHRFRDNGELTPVGAAYHSMSSEE